MLLGSIESSEPQKKKVERCSGETEEAEFLLDLWAADGLRLDEETLLCCGLSLSE